MATLLCGLGAIDVFWSVAVLATLGSAIYGIAAAELPAQEDSFTLTLFIFPLVLRGLVPVCVWNHIIYYNYYDSRSDSSKMAVKAVVFNIETTSLILLTTPILSGVAAANGVTSGVFEVYIVPVLYSVLWVAHKVHTIFLFKQRPDTPNSRKNLIFRSISQNLLPLSVGVYVLSFPVIYVAMILEWFAQRHAQEGVEANQLVEAGGDGQGEEAALIKEEEEAARERTLAPELSKFELFFYFISLGVDLFLLVTLGGEAIATEDNLVIHISFVFSLLLFGLDLTTLKSYFVPPGNGCCKVNGVNTFSWGYFDYVASSRVESYVLFALFGVLTAGVRGQLEEPTALAFVAIEYVLVNARAFYRFTSLAEVGAINVARLGQLENAFPLNIVCYIFIALVDTFRALCYHWIEVLQGAYKTCRDGNRFPQINLKCCVENAGGPV